VATKIRKQPRRLLSTYVTMKPSGRFAARAIDARSGGEASCTKDEAAEAARCAREKAAR
jgi:hypothetical protein